MEAIKKKDLPSSQYVIANSVCRYGEDGICINVKSTLHSNSHESEDMNSSRKTASVSSIW